MYKNDSYRYSVRFPAGWSVADGTVQNGTFDVKAQFAPIPGGEVSELSITTIPQYINVSILEKKEIEQVILNLLSARYQSMRLLESSSASYRLIKFYCYRFAYQKDGVSMFVLTAMTTKMFANTQLVLCHYPQESRESVEKDFYYMLSSFRRN